jgi:hypothetical protein
MCLSFGADLYEQNQTLLLDTDNRRIFRRRCFPRGVQ